MAAKIPLYYTFGNHMHWADFDWLWGYDVLPVSTRDMLTFCRETGAKGCLNYDAIGYEKMAVESPDCLAELRDAIGRGQVEVVGASYGQPYGLFHGGESNVRQFSYGVRAVMRVLGVRPRAFWEEEFYFFPQLPQMLAGHGFDCASLFFQWTWHTPSIPQEDAPAIWWEGLDGSRILAAPRNALNLHQWPEDFAFLLDSPQLRDMPAAGIVQWLELMPSPDWMCRAELIMPQLAALKARPDFDLRPVLLSEYLEAARPHAALTRRYTLDDVFHGMSLGKNADRLRRLSREGEQTLLAGEALSSLMGLFGRPYANWDVYPVWEFEEGWRELLSAQHHDNEECEGLCGFVGLRSYERGLALGGQVLDRTLRLLADRSPGRPGRAVACNPLGWSRDAVVRDPQSGRPALARGLPPFGYRVIEGPGDLEPLAPVEAVESADAITLGRGALRVTVDRRRGVISQLASAEFPNGALRADVPLADLEMTRAGLPERFADARVGLGGSPEQPEVLIQRRGASGLVEVSVSLAPELDAVDVRYEARDLPRPDGRMHASLQTALAFDLPDLALIHDHAYGLSEVHPDGKTYLRKYPTGDWMTSPQVFEEVRNPFTALQLLDFTGGDGRGVLCLHDGSQAFFKDGGVVRNILSMYDPWDEAFFHAELHARARWVPHGALAHARRWRLAQEFTRPALTAASDRPGGDLPAAFGAAWCDAPNVALTALFRETAYAGRDLDKYAARGVAHPYVLRLVEFDGRPAQATLRVPGPVAAAWRTNMLGEIEAVLQPVASGDGWAELRLELRPREIATVYLDLERGRKVLRDLDAFRSVWATVHRVEGQG
jgi:alpha-mannosidase